MEHGSSPRAWGKETQVERQISKGRIIPTCVGKSCDPRTSPRIPADHPHVRGEKRDRVAKSVRHLGSSPRAWGKERCGCVKGVSQRIIPTCVGKSISKPVSFGNNPDHPHVRGEKTLPVYPAFRSVGSSPRAWGKDRFCGFCGCDGRIIPTCVGKSSTILIGLDSSSDHPHVRGEKWGLFDVSSRW